MTEDLADIDEACPAQVKAAFAQLEVLAKTREGSLRASALLGLCTPFETEEDLRCVTGLRMFNHCVRGCECQGRCEEPFFCLSVSFIHCFIHPLAKPFASLVVLWAENAFAGMGMADYPYS